MKRLLVVSLLLMVGCAICPISSEVKQGLHRQKIILEDLKTLSTYTPKEEEISQYKRG